jgi:hypothetical protein
VSHTRGLACPKQSSLSHSVFLITVFQSLSLSPNTYMISPGQILSRPRLSCPHTNARTRVRRRRPVWSEQNEGPRRNGSAAAASEAAFLSRSLVLFSRQRPYTRCSGEQRRPHRVSRSTAAHQLVLPDNLQHIKFTSWVSFGRGGRHSQSATLEHEIWSRTKWGLYLLLSQTHTISS